MGEATSLTVKIGERCPGAARVLIVLGSAVEKSAVKRNRIRRRVRAIIKGWLEEYNGLQVVVILRRPALSLTFVALRGELDRLLARAFSKLSPTR